MEIEDVKRKVRGLLSKVHGGTEAEVSSALVLAKKLMGEFRLSEGDVSSAPSEPTAIKTVSLNPAIVPAWESMIGLVCEELFQVRCYLKSIWHIDGYKQQAITFVGFKADLEMTIDMFFSLKAQVELMREDHDGGKGAKDFYAQGIVSRLIRRVEETTYAATKEESDKCKALVVLRMDLVTKHLEITVPHLRKARQGKRMNANQYEHYQQGYKDGDRVEFAQVKLT